MTHAKNARRLVLTARVVSRFASLPRSAAIAILAGIAALVALGLALSFGQTAPKPGGAPGASDLALYRTVVQRVRAGEPYEQAVVAAQRAGHYPLKPFVVVRPPLLAEALARLPNEVAGDILLAVLAAATAGAWVIRLRSLWPRPLWLAASAAGLFTGVGAVMFGGGASLFHDAWAGLFIALSLALRTEKRFAAAVLVGLLAALIRELAIPYLLVMAMLALVERRRLEGAVFAGAAALALVALAWHAQAVMTLTTPADPASQGWVRLGGWGFVLATMRWNLLAIAAGGWVAAIIAPLALAGAAGWKDGTGLRLTALLFGYVLGFLAIGRPENSYWGLLIAPLAAVGLCLAPMALGDLVRRTRGPAAP